MPRLLSQCLSLVKSAEIGLRLYLLIVFILATIGCATNVHPETKALQTPLTPSPQNSVDDSVDHGPQFVSDRIKPTDRDVLDCNHNGIVDSLDVTAHVCNDINHNTICDYCDPDSAIYAFANGGWTSNTSQTPYLSVMYQYGKSLRI